MLRPTPTERETMMFDNPIWHALATEQLHFAERHGGAARFPPAVTALAGLATPAAVDDLAELVAPGEVVGVLFEEPAATGKLEHVDTASVLQMIHDRSTRTAEAFARLTTADSPQMMALAETTRPGPFGSRTHELGTFLGIRDGARLVAMAGQRMRVPEHIEISGVCTDPAYAGRGYAARLMVAQLALIAGAGATAFLHVRADNARAIALYERLGFRGRRTFAYAVLRGRQR
jgi:predicted GNAT family acetyltransferase